MCIITKHVKSFACAMKDNMSKIEGKHLVFKVSATEIKNCILIDNGSKAKLIDKFFVHTHGISTFRLNKKIKLELENNKVMQ